MDASENTKFKELILYISKKSEKDRKFGATKLNKLLFYSDFVGYILFGKSITGELYQKLPNGPAPVRLVPYRNSMIKNNEASLMKKKYFDNYQERLVAKREPDLTLFSRDEIDLVNQVIAKLRSANAKEVSDFSHKFLGWKCADENEIIDYKTALISSRELTDDEIEYASHINLANIACKEEEIIEL